MTKINHKSKNDVVDLVRKLLPDDPLFADEIQTQINRRRLVSQLANLRNMEGISQKDVADQLDCSQSRISKVENGFDEDVTIGVLTAYAKLVDSDLTILFSSKEDTLASQIKYHALCIKACFDEMNELVQQDAKIGKGVAAFHLEALINFVKIVEEASKNLRSTIRPTEEPQVRLQVQDIDRIESKTSAR